MNCPVCKATGPAQKLFEAPDADRPQAKLIPVVQCGQCQVCFSDTSAVTVSNDELYFDGYYGEEVLQEGGKQLVVGMFQRERQWLSLPPRQALPTKVLDVGCGDGTYLRYLPEGFERFGYEPSLSGQKALRKAGIKTIDVFAHAGAAPAVRFDLITMWQSLEHIPDPQQTLSALGPWLAPDAELFVSVPNFNSWQRKVFSGRWFHLDPTRHLVHYTPATLRALLKDCGYEVTWLTTFSLEYGVFGWWQSLFNFFPMEFNKGYKILKARKKYSNSAKHTLDLLTYALLGLPFAILGTLLMFAETAFGQGGVIHAKATLKKAL